MVTLKHPLKIGLHHSNMICWWSRPSCKKFFFG